MSTLYKLFFSFALAVFFFSCGSNDTKDNKTDKNGTDTVAMDTMPWKIYSLPAPLQIPNVIKGFKTKYSETFLVPTNTSDAKYSTSFQKAVNIGIYGIDMGYSMLYDQTQTAIDYFSRTARLADELKILGAFDKKILEDFKRNIGNRDSATYIVLSSFNNARSYLTSDNRKEVGLLISTGSFVEGLHLSVSIYKKQKSKDVVMLIGQQKLFLDNVVELLANYTENADTKALSDKLADLKKVYDEVNITYKPGKDDNTKEIDTIDITDAQLESISSKISDIRASLVK